MQHDDLASSGSETRAPESVRPGEGFNVPSYKVTCEAVCVSRTPSGTIEVLDWVCLLSRTFRQTFNPFRGTIRLELYHGQTIELDKAQTRHLVNYLDKSEGDSGFVYRRSPRPFLDQPEVNALIETEPTGGTQREREKIDPLLVGRDTPHEATAPTEAKP
jgi:hypothetical protein